MLGRRLDEPSITFRRTNRIRYCSFCQVAKSPHFLLVREATLVEQARQAHSRFFHFFCGFFGAVSSSCFLVLSQLKGR